MHLTLVRATSPCDQTPPGGGFGVRGNESPDLHMTTSNRPVLASTGMGVSCRQHRQARQTGRQNPRCW